MYRRRTPTNSEASNMPSSSSTPPFATFLLPSFRLPFLRRRLPSPTRRTSADASSTSSTAPSLSSSPTSICTTASPTSPGSPTSSLPLGLHPTDLDYPNLPPHTSLARIQPDTIRCGTCASDLAFGAQIVSKGFHGRHGRAYLVSPPSSLSTSPTVPGLFPPFSSLAHPGGSRDAEDGHEISGAELELANIRVGQSEKRVLVTGQHTVADINCAVCDSKLGWKYVDAKEASQKYKVGKFILETQRVVVYRSWEDVGGRIDGTELRRMSSAGHSSVADRGGLAGVTDSVQAENEYDNVVVFDSEDEDECDDIFSGTWDANEVAQRRKSRAAHPRPETTSVL